MWRAAGAKREDDCDGAVDEVGLDANHDLTAT
jgi:hypothetical protein